MKELIKIIKYNRTAFAYLEDFIDKSTFKLDGLFESYNMDGDRIEFIHRSGGYTICNVGSSICYTLKYKYGLDDFGRTKIVSEFIKYRFGIVCASIDTNIIR